MLFNTLYKKLNPEQKKAVDLVEGPVMVIAGPGTGKTRVLTLRIANILKKTDIAPENILALTFTESGAFSIRSNLVKIIGNAGYLANISTFHHFCNDIINDYPEYFPEIIDSVNINEGEQVKIIRTLIEETDLRALKPYGAPFFYLKTILSSIDKLKREGIGWKDFSNIVKEEEGEKNKELSLIYKKYQEKLGELKLYDYSDMIMEALKALSKNKTLLSLLQEKYQYILVDEHQDTNNAQNKILELLLSFHKNPNIFIVGDEKQAIYRFQGASLLNFNHFKELYPEMKVVKLKDNYRSVQNILDSAEKIIPSGLKSKIKRKNEKVKIYSFLTPDEENIFIAKSIKEKVKKGETPEEIAVLYRDNNDALPIARFLEKAGVPFFIESERNIMEDIDIKKLILLLRAVNEFGSEEALIEAMHIDFLGIAPLDIIKIIEFSRKRKVSAYSVIKSGELKLSSQKKISSFFEKLSSFAVSSKNKSLVDFLEEVIRDSGFLSYILSKPNSFEKMEKLKSFFEEAKKHREQGLGDFMDYLNLLKEHKFSIKGSFSSNSPKKVRLLTAHKAKGLEFNHIYIIKAVSGHWGDRKRKNLMPLPLAVFSLSGEDLEKKNDNEDERKLFYVALTRAKKEALVSYSKKDEEGKDKSPSRFVREAEESSAVKEDKENIEKDILFSPPVPLKADFKDKGLIKKLFIKKGLSVTGLNNYLQCPLKYIYTNLIRIPKAPENHQIYGIAVHAALRDFFEALKERDADKAFLLSSFSSHLKRHLLKDSDFQRFKRRGEEALGGYYDSNKGGWNLNALLEFNIKGIAFSPDIRLTGKIDKMEFLGAGKEVNVVDYKTGKPKSRNHIEGKTKGSEGEIKRQLVFYNILLNNYKKGKYRMASGEIDFIEPNERGKYKKEKFEIKKEEIKEVEEIIRKTAEEILSLSFWEKGCGKKDCHFCNLREIAYW